MSTTPNPVAAQTFMVVGTIRDDTNFAEFAALRDDEQKQLEVLRSDGRIGAHYVSPARRATFIEVIAAVTSRRALRAVSNRAHDPAARIPGLAARRFSRSGPA